MPEPFSVLIMAAGRGTRMRSALPKVLHPICGRPMVEWVIDAARQAGADRIVCVTRPGEGVADELPEGVEVAEQTEGEGTGSAVLAARESVPPDRPVVVLSGDHPLLTSDEVGHLVDAHRRDGAAATMLTTEALDPSGYGRIVRNEDGSVERIVETKNTEGVAPEELAIREINLGTYAFEPGELMSTLDGADLKDGERYLTEVFPAMTQRGLTVVSHRTEDADAAQGINDRADLIEVERLARRRLVAEHARAGVTFLAPDTNVIDVGVTIGEETVVGAGVTLSGATSVGAGCDLGPHTTAIDARLGDRVSVAHSYLVECEIHDEATIGPFAYLRPGAVIGEGAKIGTFVEVKNSNIGAGAKVPHLSYIGDADVGEKANVAAGNITANYDGRRKHRTQIGKSVKTGVNTSFVAPVEVGDGAYTGAGSVIVEDVPPGALGISRPEQKNVEGYTERVEKEDEPSP